MNDKINVTVGGEEKTLFMSYTKLNRLSDEVGSVEGLAHVFLNPKLQEKLLSMVLTPAGEKKLIDLEQVEISLQDIKKIVDWMGDHIMDFFLDGLQRMQALESQNQERMQNLMHSLTGSLDSPLETPAAGSTTSTPQTSTESSSEAPSET